KGGRTNENLAADADHRAHRLQARTFGFGVRSEQLDGERKTHARLRYCRSGGRACYPPMEAVHEQHLEDRVDDVRDDNDLEGPAEVRDAAQVTLTGERDQC